MAEPIGSLRVDLSARIAKFVADLKKAGAGLAGLQKKFKKLGPQLTSVGKNMSLFVTGPIAGLGALTLKAAGDFEAGMNKVAAVSGATGDQLQMMRDQAKELGATTQFSATQAADAMNFLAMAGFDADKVMAAMPGTLQLASAAQMDLGAAADTVSNILTGYRMETEELGHVNDVLVKTFTRTNTNLQQLGEAMKFAGPVASAAGVKFETAAAAVGLMGNAGIQASMAGTALRGAITRMLNPTKMVREAMEEANLTFVDATGKLKPMDQIIRELEPHADNAGLMMKIFGQRAGPAMAGLVSQGADALVGLTGELEASAGTAARIAEVQMQGFNGAMKELKSAFEGVQIAVAESGLLEFATNLVKKGAGALRWFAGLDESIKKTVLVFAGAFAAGGPILVVVGAAMSALALISAPLLIGGAIVVGIAAGIGAIVANWQLLSDTGVAIWQGLTEAIKLATNTATGWVTSSWSAVTEAVGGTFMGLSTRIGEIIRAMIEMIVSLFTGLVERVMVPVRRVTEGVKGAWMFLKQTLVGQSIVPDMLELIRMHFQQSATTLGQTTAGTAQTVGAGFAFMSEQTVGTMQQMGTQLGGILNQMFGENKAFSLASAIVATALAVDRALASLPFPANLAAAALVGAKGAVQIATIAGTQLAAGGLVTGPTFAMLGEGGQHELVLPLDRADEFMGGSDQTIQFIADGRLLGELAVKHMPRTVRLKLGTAFG